MLCVYKNEIIRYSLNFNKLFLKLKTQRVTQNSDKLYLIFLNHYLNNLLDT